MNENLIEAKYDITKKTKIKKFYDDNKKLIYVFISFAMLSIFGIIYYLENKESKRIALGDDFVQAQIYINHGEKDKAKKLLEKIIYENDSTYSSLSLFLLLNEDLIKDNNKINNFFDHLLKNNKFEKEMENLIILKRSLYYLSNLENEEKLLNSIKPLLKDESVWKAHALILMGDYYFSKKSFFKAKEFYNEIMNLKNIDASFYNKASNQLRLID